MKTVHNLEAFTMSEAYDHTQCSDTIQDGDILLVRDGVAIMVEAWPVMAVGISAVFHNVSHGFHAETSDKYTESFSEANSSIDILKARAEENTAMDIDAVINTIEFRIHEDKNGICRILDNDNEIMFTSADYSIALHKLETEYLSPDQVEALKLHFEVMAEIEAEDRANRSLSCDHYAGF